MSENKHTPEPWYVVDAPWGDGTWINSGSPDPHHEGFIADCEDINGDVDIDTARINARRIVACVNACSGIGNELLENICMISGGIAGRFAEQRRYLNETEKQRDELLAALTLIASGEAEQRVAEAIASFVDTTATYDTSKEIAEAIRRGAWKAFK